MDDDGEDEKENEENNTVHSESFCQSDILQCDGGNSLDLSSNNDSVSTQGISENEVEGDSEDEGNEEDDNDECEEESCEIKGVFEQVRDRTLEILNGQTIKSLTLL